jgi:signal transduction histidine kinase
LLSERGQSTYAFTRIERIIGRVFSLASVATSLETLANAIAQTQLVQPVYLYSSLGLIFSAQLLAVFTFWFGSANKNVYWFHGAAYLIAFALYPISVSGLTDFPDGFRPWLWWATGTATMAMGMYLTKWWSIAYLGFVPVSWFFLRVLPIGGSGTVGSALLDFFYIILFAAAVLTLIGMMRTAAIAVDRKNDALAEASAKRAEVDATERERQKLDDLVHDQVLTTLLLAAKADSPTSQALAAESAEIAIERLSNTASESTDALQEVSVGAFIDSLSANLTRNFPDATQSVSKDLDFQLPIPVAIAFADASIQALTNSVQHAGKKAIRQVRIKADQHGLKVVVRDDGRGFRESKIPKNRFGVRNSIRRRVTSVGGVVFIKAEPRKGSTVVMVWVPNA